MTESSSTAQVSLPTAHGKIILQAPPFEEFIGTVDLDCDVADERCLPGDDIETIHERARARHSRLRAQERIQTRGARTVGRHRFGGRCSARVRSNRRGKRSERDDAFALFVALEYRRFG